MTATLLIGLWLGSTPANAPAAAETPASEAPAPAALDRPPPSTYDRLQQSGGGTSDDTEISWSSQLLKTLLGLGIVVGLIYLLFRLGLARYLGGAALRGSGRGLKVVERTQLDARHALLIVEVEGHRLLLATGEQGVQRLADLTTPGAVPAGSFTQILTQTASPRPPSAAGAPGDNDGQ